MRRELAAFLGCVGVAGVAAAGTVRVVVDMGPNTPGIQSRVMVQPGTTVVPGVAVYIYDPEGGSSMLSIGYIGALDRGIAFGHMPDSWNYGTVVSLTAHQGAPVIAGNTGFAGPALDPAFYGPEVQYLEYGAVATPQPIPTTPGAPIFTVDVNLSNAQLGDVFRFFLCDYVRVWSGGAHGAFTTHVGASLDTGGDYVLDNTLTRYGSDPDGAIPVPPASFLVDFIDGPFGATITVGCYANCDNSTTPPILNVQDFACFLNRFAAGEPWANCNRSVNPPPILNVQDFVCFLNLFAAGCG